MKPLSDSNVQMICVRPERRWRGRRPCFVLEASLFWPNVCPLMLGWRCLDGLLEESKTGDRSVFFPPLLSNGFSSLTNISFLFMSHKPTASLDKMNPSQLLELKTAFREEVKL